MRTQEYVVAGVIGLLVVGLGYFALRDHYTATLARLDAQRQTTDSVLTVLWTQEAQRAVREADDRRRLDSLTAENTRLRARATQRVQAIRETGTRLTTDTTTPPEVAEQVAALVAQVDSLVIEHAAERQAYEDRIAILTRQVAERDTVIQRLNDGVRRLTQERDGYRNASRSLGRKLTAALPAIAAGVILGRAL